MGSRTRNVLYTAGRQCSACRLLRRVETPRVVYYAESPRYFFKKNSLSRLLQGIETPRIVYYGESELPVSFTTGSHCYLRGVDHENLNDSPNL